MTGMHAEYFETRFRTGTLEDDWPTRFAVVTAFATTGELWTADENVAADAALLDELRAAGIWHRRVTGYSPATGHAEPGWAADLPFEAACDMGRRFRQDAIYWIDGDDLFVSHCDDRRLPVPVGRFRERVTATPD